jgi:hypothetical protein
MESDSAFAHDYLPLDVIDEAWTAESLPHDEIEIPPEHDLHVDDHELETMRIQSNMNDKDEEDKWADLGLDLLAEVGAPRG